MNKNAKIVLVLGGMLLVAMLATWLGMQYPKERLAPRQYSYVALVLRTTSQDQPWVSGSIINVHLRATNIGVLEWLGIRNHVIDTFGGNTNQGVVILGITKLDE